MINKFKKTIVLVVVVSAVIVAGLFAFKSWSGGAFAPKAESVIGEAGEAMSSLDSMDFNYIQDIKSSSSEEGSESYGVTCTGSMEFPTNASIKCEGAFEGSGTRSEETVYYKGKMYVPLSSLGEEGDDFVEIDAADEAYESVELFYGSNVLGFLASGGGTVESIEEFEYDGERAYKVLFKIDYADARGENPVFQLLIPGGGEGQISGEIVIGKSDHFVRTMRLDASSASSLSVSMSYVFSGFNSAMEVKKPDNVIEKPSASGSSGNKDLSSVALRNSQRKTDIRQLAFILESYYEEEGEYPESGEVDRTDNTKGVLFKTLVPDMLESLPIDPMPEDYYYGYVCTGGEQYTLTAALEIEGSEETELYEYEGPQ